VRVANFSFAPLIDKLPYALMDGSLRELSELLELRIVLESGMIEQAVAAMGPDDVAALQLVLERMRSLAERGEAFPEDDREFHRTLFAPLGNQTLLKLLDVFWLAFTKTMVVVDIRDPDPLKTFDDHAVIVAAVADGNGVRAREALVDRHYAGIATRVRAARASR
jgi:DNA-binding FadR family transcriptional regulator